MEVEEDEEELTEVPALHVGDAEVNKSLKVSFYYKSKFQSLHFFYFISTWFISTLGFKLPQIAQFKTKF